MFLIHRLELPWILDLQSLTNLKEVMVFCSSYGWRCLFYLSLLIYFTISRREGIRIFVLLGLSTPLVDMVKIAFRSPRPHWLDSQIQVLDSSLGYGLPSGHVVSCCIVSILASKSVGTVWAWLGAVLMIFGMSIARVYLGVHFFSDVLAGLALAVGLIFLAKRAEPPVRAFFRSTSIPVQLIACGALVDLLLCIRLVLGYELKKIAIPEPWTAFLTNSDDLGDMIESFTTLLVILCAATLANRYCRFVIKGPWWRYAASLSFAFAGLLLIRQSNHLIQSDGFEIWSDIATSGLQNCWVLFFAPWLLVKTHLLESESPSFNEPVTDS